MEDVKPGPDTARENAGQRTKPKVSTHRVKIHRLKGKIKTLTASLEKASKSGSITNIIKNASRYLDTSTLDFFASQLRIGKQRLKGRRYTNKDKLFAFALHYQSPSAYRFCRKIFALPCERSLRRWLEKVRVQPGFNNTSFEILQRKAKTMSERDKVCVLTLDEMSLKSGLYYDLQKDIIEGMEDFGSLGKSKNLATQALVFMVRGLACKWKQPVGYFLANAATPGSKQKVLLLECIEKIEEAGFTVKVVIGDQGSNNRKMFRMMGVSADKPFIERKTSEGNVQKVYCMFDPPHLLKSVRNNLKQHIFVVDGHKVNWNYIVEFYNHDSKLPLRTAPKLTAKHIELPPFTKMRVCLASQVLSHSVASGILTYSSLGKLPSEAVYTAEFLERMDKLFDSFNSRKLRETKTYRAAATPSSVHVSFWKDCIEWIKKWKVKDGSTDKIACFQGWVTTITAVVQLFNELTTGDQFSFLLTNRLNQDCLENLFSILRSRGGHRDNPTANEFRAALKQVMCSKMMAPLGNQNWESDSDSFLDLTASFKSQGNSGTSEGSTETNDDHFNHICDNLDKMIDQPQNNVIVYVAGYLAKQILAKHKNCETCKNALLKNAAFMEDPSELLLNYKAYCIEESDFGGLTVPSDNFSDFVVVCEKVFVKCFNDYFHINAIGKRIVERIHIGLTNNNLHLDLCSSERVTSFISFFVRIRLHAAVKFYNKSLFNKKVVDSEKKVKRKSRKLVKISHL